MLQGSMSGGWMAMLKQSFIGSGVSVLTMILGNAVSAWLITSERIQESAAGYCILATLIASIAIGGLTAMRKMQEKRLPLMLLVGAEVFLFLVVLKMLFFSGEWDGVGVTAGIIVGCSAALAILLSGKGKGTVKRRKKKNVL